MRNQLCVAVAAALVFAGGCETGTTTPEKAAVTNGNGVDKLGASEILDRAAKASASASSVRLRGKLRDSGKVLGIDLKVAGNRAASGHILDGGERIDLIRIGSVVYIKGNRAFLKNSVGSGAENLLSGKYFTAKVKDKDFAAFTSLTLVSTIFSELLKPEGALGKGERAQINGRAAIALTDGTGGKIYVATQDQPYVLRLSPGGSSEYLDFLAYGENVTVKRPAASLIVDAG